MTEIVYQDELAKKLGRSLSTLRYWRHIGYGPRSFKLGGRIVYKLDDVQQWIEAAYHSDEPEVRAS